MNKEKEIDEKEIYRLNLKKKGAKTLLHWQGPEYENYAKDYRWYLIASILLSLIVFYAVWNDSPLMAIVFILIGMVGYIYLEKPPRILNFRITPSGIVAGNELYLFEEAESFWIFYDPPHRRIISLKMKNRFIPYVHFPLHQVDPVDVHKILVKFLPQKKQKPSLVDVLERLLHI